MVLAGRPPGDRSAEAAVPAPDAGFVDVPGARLYYETHGSGPLMVMIAGAAGSAEPYRPIASRLAARYRVVAYDRRGFSRSALVGDQDYEHRLETDADDVRALVEHAGGGPAIVFGNSSGAIVGLEVLIRHPSAVSLVVAHEPPVLNELPDDAGWVEFFSSLYDLYRASGPGPAMARFRERSFPESDREVMARVPPNEFSAANARYWFDHELRQYPFRSLDHEALVRNVDHLLLAVGRESRGFPCYQSAAALGERLGVRPVEMPGGHVGFIAHADEFAADLDHEVTRHLLSR